jgi:hypothetical protein
VDDTYTYKSSQPDRRWFMRIDLRQANDNRPAPSRVADHCCELRQHRGRYSPLAVTFGAR